jgi:hypothetical protein
MQRLDVYRVVGDYDSVIDWAWLREVAFDHYRTGLNVRVPLQYRKEFLLQFRESVCWVDSTVELGHHKGYKN